MTFLTDKANKVEQQIHEVENQIQELQHTKTELEKEQARLDEATQDYNRAIEALNVLFVKADDETLALIKQDLAERYDLGDNNENDSSNGNKGGDGGSPSQNTSQPSASNNGTTTKSQTPKKSRQTTGSTKSMFPNEANKLRPSIAPGQMSGHHWYSKIDVAGIQEEIWIQPSLGEGFSNYILGGRVYFNLSSQEFEALIDQECLTTDYYRENAIEAVLNYHNIKAESPEIVLPL